MQIYEELKARGLIAQVTDEEEIRELVNNGKATFYIGFDPTADSLHVGHFMALCLMKRLQMAGNRPIALIGGGTGYIGDPSGRTDMRSMMTPETIQHNCDCFKKQMERFIEFGEGKAQMVNNADWLLKLNYVELLREVHEAGKLPVVNFAAGGIATPADAALMMQLGAEGVFVGSGIFKSGDPARRAEATVKATTNFNDPEMLAALSEDLGEAMVGINEQEIQIIMEERGQ